MTDPMPAPGWYPAPHANNVQRYWDGAQWLEPQQATATTVLPHAEHGAPTGSSEQASKSTAPWGIIALVAGIVAFFTGIVPVVGALLGAGAITVAIIALQKKQSKGLAIAGIVLGALAAVASIGVAAGISTISPASDDKPAAVETEAPVDGAADEEEEDPEPAAEVTVPDVVGLPVSQAITVLEDAGLDAPQLSSFEDPEALVLSTSRAAGSLATERAAITITVQEKPKLSLSQQNAVDKAQGYLRLAGFSRTGLIEQLEFEGFGTEDATFGVDNAGADWNAECAEKAQSYLDLTSFSRQGLYDQLAFEGFQAAEIEFALGQVGY